MTTPPSDKRHVSTAVKAILIASALYVGIPLVGYVSTKISSLFESPIVPSTNSKPSLEVLRAAKYITKWRTEYQNTTEYKHLTLPEFVQLKKRREKEVNDAIIADINDIQKEAKNNNPDNTIPGAYIVRENVRMWNRSLLLIGDNLELIRE